MHNKMPIRMDGHFYLSGVLCAEFINCVWFEVLLGESCVGNTWRPTDYTLDETLATQLQQAAHEAVAAVYGEDYAK